MTHLWRGTTAWRGRRRWCRNTSSGWGSLQLSRPTCAAVMRANGTRWCGTCPTGSCTPFLSPLNPGAVCPWTGLRTYHQATTTTILVVVDRLTKQAIFIATTKSMSAPDVASLFIHNVIRLHGLPDSLVSDRDPAFTSHFWRRLQELLGIRANRSSAFHPRCYDAQRKERRSLKANTIHKVLNGMGKSTIEKGKYMSC